MSRGAVATINLSALRNNFSCLRALVNQRSILAMIKSNGYGHGLLRVAKTLSDADAFGVACLEEALTLRENGIETPIVVMGGFYEANELPDFLKHDLGVVVHRPDQIDLLEKNKLSKPLSVWLKIDTGMHRLGFPADQTTAVYQRLRAIEAVKKPVRIMTHLADADNPDRAFTEAQIKKFAEITHAISAPKSILNSAGIVAYPDALADWVRPGIMLYGVSPFSQRSGIEMGLRPVMTLSAKLIAVKHCRPGDAIGYGCTWHCEEDMPIGIVGIGYGDGYPRHAKSGTPTWLNGKICPLVGRVSMDMIAIDLRARPNAEVGDRVILWGDHLPIEQVATASDTIGYELLCGVTPRVTFRETDNESTIESQ